MDPNAIGSINDVATRLTPVGILLFMVVGFIVGWLITPGRFNDWKAHAEMWRKEAEENRKALIAITSDMKELTRAIEPLGPALKQLSEDHEETDRCISAISTRVEQWQNEWRATRRTTP